MLIAECEFQLKYGAIYNQKLRETKAYVDDPSSLRAEVSAGIEKINKSTLRPPYPDQYAYRMTHYKGFAKYPERLKNLIVAENEPCSAVRSFMPSIMDIEPNSRCNCRCIMCQVSGWKGSKRAEDMVYNEFRRFIDGQAYLTEVKLHGMGDPFLNISFIDMVQYLSTQHIWVRTSTNGLLLHNNDNYRRVIDSGLGEIQVSFDGATKEVFEKIRRGSNFELVVRNCMMLNEYANKQDRLYTRMWVLIQKHNRHQLFEFAGMAKKMGFRRISFSVSLNDWGQEKWNRKNKARQSERLRDDEKICLVEASLKEDIDITVWEQANKYSTDRVENLCPWPFSRPYISSDMRIVPCCMIADPRVSDLGNAQDFKSCWNSHKYQNFRLAHMSGNIPAYCRNCYIAENK